MGARTLPQLEEILGENSAARPVLPVSGASSALATSSLGVLVGDPVHLRLLESAALQLGLTPVVLPQDILTADLSPEDARRIGRTLNNFDLILADQTLALRLRRFFSSGQRRDEGAHPFIVAVCSSAENASEPTVPASAFDGVLKLPMPPAALAAQLGILVYAHRAFASRYNNALEELHLNRRIFRSVTSGISVASATEPDLPLVYVNPAFEVMTGYCLEEVQGRNCRFLQGSLIDQPGVASLRDAIRDKREITVLLRNFRKDGAPFWNELSLSPIFNREGELTHFVGIQTDVTARVEFEAALRESEKLAAVGRLAAAISHEINNPLEILTNVLYLARTAASPEETTRYLELAEKELQRVALITSQSLRFYKQSTRAQAMLAPELIASVLHLYEGRAESLEVSLERRDRPSDPLLCFESEVRQVLNNFVRNSLDALGGKPGRILVRSHAGTDWHTGRRGVVLTVADNGSGMSSSTRESLFKPFFTTKGLAGNGLGLWVSGEIITRHQGRVAVRSSDRPRLHGTVFRFFLPYGPAAS